MKKFSLINIDFEFEEDDVIIYEMPSFCGGDYLAIVISDPKYGLYINADDNHFESCKDYSVKRQGIYI